MLISAGFDAHARDPLADQRLEAEDFAWATRALVSVARAALRRTYRLLPGGRLRPRRPGGLGDRAREGAGGPMTTPGGVGDPGPPRRAGAVAQDAPERRGLSPVVGDLRGGRAEARPVPAAGAGGDGLRSRHGRSAPRAAGRSRAPRRSPSAASSSGTSSSSRRPCLRRRCRIGSACRRAGGG